MNPIRRRMLHPLRSRHNPLTQAALTFILFAVFMAAHDAVSELLELRQENASVKETLAKDTEMIAELTQFAEGETKLVEVTGKYAVERTVQRKTYEVK